MQPVSTTHRNIREICELEKSISACLLTPDDQGGTQQQVRRFGTMTRDLLELSNWLASNQVTHVAMESTGDLHSYGNATAEAFITRQWLPDVPKTPAHRGTGRTLAGKPLFNETIRYRCGAVGSSWLFHRHQVHFRNHGSPRLARAVAADISQNINSPRTRSHAPQNSIVSIETKPARGAEARCGNGRHAATRRSRSACSNTCHCTCVCLRRTL
jgi:hypothetical protein